MFFIVPSACHLSAQMTDAVETLAEETNFGSAL